jgi:hypothetical protein
MARSLANNVCNIIEEICGKLADFMNMNKIKLFLEAASYISTIWSLVILFLFCSIPIPSEHFKSIHLYATFKLSIKTKSNSKAEFPDYLCINIFSYDSYLPISINLLQGNLKYLFVLERHQKDFLAIELR